MEQFTNHSRFHLKPTHEHCDTGGAIEICQFTGSRLPGLHNETRDKSTPSKGHRDLELQYHVVIPLRSAVTVHEDNSLSALPCSYYAHAPRKAIVHGCTGTCQTELILIAFAAHHTGWTYTADSTAPERDGCRASACT